MRHLGRFKFLTLAFIVSLIICSHAAAEKKTVELENADGKKIKAELLEKNNDKVKIRVGRKVYTLSLDKLSESSAALVRNADIPMICKFEIVGDMTKRGKKYTTSYTVSDGEGGRTEMYRSCRTDTVSGKIIIKNRDVKDPSPAAKLYVAWSRIVHLWQ